MANALNAGSFTTPKQTIERWPCRLVFDISIDVTAVAVKLIDIPENTILLETFLAVYQAEAGATSTKVDVRRTDGSTPVTLWTGSADNMGALGEDLGAFTVPEIPLAETDEFYEVLPTIVGTATTPGKGYLVMLVMRSTY